VTGRSFLMPNYAPPPVTCVRGEGSRLWDVDGKEYLDFLGGLAVTSLGHSHPAVAAAVAEQARTLLHVCNLFGTTVGPEVAETLDRLIGGPAGQIFFCNSGAEANECAIKLARKWGGGAGRGPKGHTRHGVVSTYGSFHGRTLAALAATGQPTKHEPFQPLPEGFRHVALGDVEAMDAAVDPSVVGAVLLEPIQGEGGVNVPPKGWFAEVRRICDERDVLLVLDEVQTGLGRTGRVLACDHEGIRPDGLTLGKALGGGLLPVSAFLAREDVMAQFTPGDHGSTFGGNPLSAAVGEAALKLLEREQLARRAHDQGEYLMAQLGKLNHPAITDIRGKGLLVGVEIDPKFASARLVCEGLMAEGILSKDTHGTVVRFAPPLVIEREQIDFAVAAVQRVLKSLESKAKVRETETV